MSIRSDSPVLSNDTLALQLNQQLPLHVSSQLIQQNPKLALLLEDLTQRITPAAVTTSTQLAYNTAAAALKQARRGYLEQAALLHYTLSAARSAQSPKALCHIEDAIALSQLAVSLQLTPIPDGRHRVQSNVKAFPVNHKKSNNTQDGCNKTSYLREYKKDSSFFDGDKSSLPGRTTTNNKTYHHDNYYNKKQSFEESVGRFIDDSVGDDSDGQKRTESSSSSTRSSNATAAMEVSDDSSTAGNGSTAEAYAWAVKNKSKNLRELSSSRVLHERAMRLSGGARVVAVLLQHSSGRLSDAWASILPCVTPVTKEICGGGGAALQHISQLATSITTNTQHLNLCAAATQALILQVDGQLVQYGSSLSQLVQQRRLSHHPLQHLTYLATTLMTEYSKLRCVELQLLCSTYPPEGITNLRSLLRQLQQQTVDAELSMTALQHKLEPYKHIDPSYLALLDQYNKLKSDIDFCTVART